MLTIDDLERKFYQERYGMPKFRENLANNPSLDSNATNWGIWPGSGGGAATTTRETSGGVVGSSFIRGTWTAASTSTGDISHIILDTSLVKPGDRISFSMWVRANTARTFAPGIQWHDQFGVALPGGSVVGPATGVIPANTWTLLKLENVVMPEDAKRFKVMARLTTNMAIGDIVDADACLIERDASVGEYFDGNTPGYEWSGAVGNSISRSVGSGLSTGRVIERENLIPNPLFDASTVLWSSNSVNATRTFDGAKGNLGSLSVMINLDAVGPYGVNNSGARKSVIQGKDYVASAYVRSNPSRNVQIKIRWYDAITGGNEITPASSSAFVACDDVNWTRLWITGQPPVGATFALIQINYSGSDNAINDKLWVTAPQFEEGTIPSPFFSGDTADFNNGSYEWNGAQHYGTSRLYVPEPVLRENLIEQINPPAGGTLIKNVQDEWFAFSTTDFSNSPMRSQVNLNNLVNGQTYYIAAEVYNPGSNNVNVHMDWCDQPPSTVDVTLRPGESRVLKSSGVRPVYDNTYRFMDLNTNGPVAWVRRMTVSVAPTEPFDGSSPNSFWTNSFLNSSYGNSKSRMIDVNSRDYGILERDFWAKTSGLTPKESYSVADHQMASLKQSEPVSGTVNDMLRSFYARQSGLPASASASDHELAFYQNRLGVS